jgi:hypothetical protein
MEKKADPVAMTAIPKFLGQRHQVIIMNPDDIVRLQKLFQFRREKPVDPHIPTEIAAREFRKIQSVVQDWPKHLIGIAIVIFVIVLFPKVDQYVGLLTVLNGLHVHVGGDSDLTAPSKPNSGVASQNRSDCNSKPARLVLNVADRHLDTIGDHD